MAFSEKEGPSGGRIEKFPCPLCGSNAGTIKHTYKSPPDVFGTFTVRQCDVCRHMFTHPLPSKALLESIYDSDAHLSFQSTKEHLEARREEDNSRWDLILRHIRAGTVVDLGCGTGTFLALAPNHGLKGFGIEPYPKLAEFARNEMEVEVYASLEELEDIVNSVDVIALWDVLEHLENPREILKQVKDRLRPGGLLVIGVPNAASLGARLFGGHWVGWCVPIHMHHFTIDILRRLLNEHGFHILEERFIQYPFITIESFEMLMGKDMSALGAFNAVPTRLSSFLRSMIGRSPRWVDKCSEACARLLLRLTKNEKKRHKRSYLTIVADKVSH